MDGKILIKPYEHYWHTEFLNEKNKIVPLLNEEIIAIEHIGSTAVEGLGAKPLIDMMIGVTNLQITENWREPLAEIGYEYVPKKHLIGVFLEKGNGERVVIICMFIFIIVRNGRTTYYFENF